MPKAYWIAHVDVHDNEIYAKYKEANAIAFAKYGARFVVRGGEQTIEEGHSKLRTVVIEFENLETAQKCYLSEEYQKAKKIREPVSTGDLIIVEGYDGE
tara:strand:- start:775 stop:1071 length:297 start_codon:yes stop_codon:yes gene_type:complete